MIKQLHTYLLSHEDYWFNEREGFPFEFSHHAYGHVGGVTVGCLVESNSTTVGDNLKEIAEHHAALVAAGDWVSEIRIIDRAEARREHEKIQKKYREEEKYYHSVQYMLDRFEIHRLPTLREVEEAKNLIKDAPPFDRWEDGPKINLDDKEVYASTIISAAVQAEFYGHL